MSDKILREAYERIRAIEEEIVDEGNSSRDDITDGIELLTEIQDRLFEVIEELTDAIRAYVPGDQRYWEAYGLAQLKIIAGSDEYASHDKSINSLIKTLKDELGGEENDSSDERDW